MKPKYQTARIWVSTLKMLRLLHAETGKPMTLLLDEMVKKEYERVKQEL